MIKGLLSVIIMGAVLICPGCGKTKPISGITESKTSYSIASATGSKESSEERHSRIMNQRFDSGQEAYTAYIEEAAMFETDYCTYSLIYIDDDSIPELYIYRGIPPFYGQYVLTYHNGKLCEEQLYRVGFQYIPKTGLIYNSDGKWDSGYIATIFKLSDGEFKMLGQGHTDDPGDGDKSRYSYKWDGKKCSSEEYYSTIQRLFPEDKGVYPEEWYKKEEILWLLCE